MSHEAWTVVDLGFGDQGKGTTVDFLVRDRGARTVVRYNGGPQAAHNVVTDDGRHHTFAQLGAGSFVPGVVTVLADTMAIQPWDLLVEAERLAHSGVPDAVDRLLIAEDAIVVTPFHRAANRLRERARGAARHGSCGLGVGEAIDDARSGRPTVRARDLAEPTRLVKLLSDIQAAKAPLATLADALPDDIDAQAARDDLREPRLPAFASELLDGFRRRARVVSSDVIARAVQAGPVVLEGAHGVLLDEDVGFHPYTTWSVCTDRHARGFLDRHGHAGPRATLGVLRAYATRHGPGPFPSAWPADAPAATRLVEPHNGDGAWQGPFRVGAFDAVLARYARDRLARLDGLVLTCLDCVTSPWPVVDSYMIGGAVVTDLTPGGDLEAQRALGERLARAGPGQHSLPDEAAFVAWVGAAVAPVALLSRGPTASAKTWSASFGIRHGVLNL